MNPTVSGILAALASPLAMTIGFVVWDKVWKGSPLLLNFLKCSIGTCFFILTIAGLEGFYWMKHTSNKASLMLFVSAIIGIIVGDTFWLEALQLIGARKVVMFDALKPFLATFFGFFLLAENINWMMLVGVIITVVGVLIVSLEKASNIDSGSEQPRNVEEEKKAHQNFGPQVLNCQEAVFSGNIPPVSVVNDSAKKGESNQPTTGNIHKNSRNAFTFKCGFLNKGYAFAVINIFLDVYGAVLTRQYGEKMSTWDINTIRFGSASAVLLLAVFLKKIVIVINNVQATTASELQSMTYTDWIKIVLGIFLVTYIAPALSQYALFKINLAILITLSSLSPIFSLPIVRILKGEKVSRLAIFGSLLGSLGIIPLCFSSPS